MVPMAVAGASKDKPSRDLAEIKLPEQIFVVLIVCFFIAWLI